MQNELQLVEKLVGKKQFGKCGRGKRKNEIFFLFKKKKLFYLKWRQWAVDNIEKAEVVQFLSFIYA